MMRLGIVRVWLMLAVSCFGQGPSMVVGRWQHKGKDIPLTSVELTVRIAGGLAETRYDLCFRNPFSRQVEGEFTLRLPKGATISRYAQDVNGRMRDAVAVEKERAREAYESVVRRRIDPGLVEREAGQVYRTKVFPFPSKGEKRVSISYVEELGEENGRMIYQLALGDDWRPGKFRCRVLGGKGVEVVDGAGMGLSSVAAAGLEGVGRPVGTLRLDAGAPDEAVVVAKDGDGTAFYLRCRMPDVWQRQRARPKRLALVWDASATGSLRDHGKELAALDAWFSRMDGTKVILWILRNELERSGEFVVRGGNWAELREVLEKVDYDGGTDFSGLAEAAAGEDLVVLASDGVASLGSVPGVLGVPLIWMRSGTAAEAGGLAEIARDSGGVVVSEDLTIGRMVERMNRERMRLLRVEGALRQDWIADSPEERDGMLVVSGKLSGRVANKLRLRFGYGDKVEETRTLRYHQDVSGASLVGRVHAQRVLEKMERAWDVDEEAIVDHCRKNHLVSDFTSLLVLERMRDYVRHRIRPPEEELWAEYDEQVGRAESRRQEGELFRGAMSIMFGRRYRDRKQWHDAVFPGYEVLLLPRFKQVGIWKRAVDRVFGPEQLDEDAYGVLAGWYGRAKNVMLGGAQLSNSGQFREWREAVDRLTKEGETLESTKLRKPEEGEVIAVSVRGFVNEPGVVTGKAGLTLTKAVELAGGCSGEPGGLVSLYRSSGKAVLNVLSEEYDDIPLFPGDMLVVDWKTADDWYDTVDGFGAVDPFAEGGSGPRGASKQAAVLSAGGAPVVEIRNAGGGDSSGGRSGGRAAGRVAAVWTQQDGSGADVESFGLALENGADVENAYRALRGGKFHPDGFYVEVARVLMDSGHGKLALRALSNIVEFCPSDPEVRRAHGFWLAEFGNGDEAEDVFEKLAESEMNGLRDNWNRGLVCAERGLFASAVEGLAKGLRLQSSRNRWDGLELAMMELAAWLKRGGLDGVGYGIDLTRVRGGLEPLDSDVRVVVSQSGNGWVRLRVKEPTGREIGYGTSGIGGRICRDTWGGDYMIRHAVPGRYQVFCGAGKGTTVRVEVHTDWGRPEQKTRVVTKMLDADRSVEVAGFEVEFRPKE